MEVRRPAQIAMHTTQKDANRVPLDTNQTTTHVCRRSALATMEQRLQHQVALRKVKTAAIATLDIIWMATVAL
jgi:hypothetical protein